MGQGIYLGDSLIKDNPGKVEGEYVTLLDEPFYRIRHYDRMPSFFMSIVSASDHWMFISSTGGLTAGRASAESAAFPYYTDDRLTEDAGNTGAVALFRITRGGRESLWQPFAYGCEDVYQVERDLYKNKLGDKLVFEERNLDLGVTYRYAWRFSDRYGLIKTAWLTHDGSERVQAALLDGVQNLLPAGASTSMQNTLSNLLNAYKRNELDPRTGLATFSLSSALSDLPEPSEALRTTTAWQVGLQGTRTLLSTEQISAFRRGHSIRTETDIRGQRGAYLVYKELTLPPGAQVQWSLAVDVNQDRSRVTALTQALRKPARLQVSLEEDIQAGSAALESIVASADGLQLTGDPLATAHHFSNVLFNTMRGGIFVHNYQLTKMDLLEFISIRNKKVLQEQASFFAGLPEVIENRDLLNRAAASSSADLERLCYEYLPLTFGRRHGDPSRPWNRFSINIKKSDGTQRLDYQGNWRDIFQNWEPLAWSYPEFTGNMICKFLNATTVDGYNPYRITREGIEWEAPTPNDPWANIGYWGDHQIIYLEKLLEISEQFHPGALRSLLDRKIFSHANVPFRIKPYHSMLEDWYNTILFDREADAKAHEAVKEIGSDGKLLRTAEGAIVHASLAEKLLILLLAKLSNFVPEGGIWMNTQRPEWNDGNNALVGKGLSVVTLGYLRRYVGLFIELLKGDTGKGYSISREVKKLFTAMERSFVNHQDALAGPFSDEERRAMLDELGQAGSDYRWSYYKESLSGSSANLERAGLVTFLELVMQYIDHSLRANLRPDHMYHAYNVLHISEGRVEVGHMYEMLEGQVAILSSGLLSGEESLALLKSLRQSAMYRPDQHSYTLYPDRDLPGFFRKNCIQPEQVQGSLLVAGLVACGDTSLISRDAEGVYHFNGDFHNARDVKRALTALKEKQEFTELVEEESADILELFELTFDHHSFTGRSGTFFAYEGLGSIYWHMVTKLLLAVEEVTLRAKEAGESPAVVKSLAAAYHDIRKGLGYNKSAVEYGAFPTDPYSHTPAGQGARQPGMTGQVKEEILARWAELGMRVEDGVISFEPVLLEKREHLREAADFNYIDVDGQRRTVSIPAGRLAFTFDQVPVVYAPGKTKKLEVLLSSGECVTIDGHGLGPDLSRHVFQRDGRVAQITVYQP